MRLFPVLAALLSFIACARAEEGTGGRFAFVALGDMPYVREEAAVLDPHAPANRAFRELIGRINAAAPAFSVHVGDIKSGGTRCTDAHLALLADWFGTFDGPLVYTPGDNEWTDCHRTGSDPLARLERLRQVFFARPDSLGRAPMALERQSGFPENARWQAGGVVFATLHAVGSRDNSAVPAEHGPRRQAAIAWMEEAFARARASEARGVALFLQANPGWYCGREECQPRKPEDAAAYDTLVAALEREARAFARPVLLVHGDTHVFTLDKPLPDLWTLTRLEVFGEHDTHAVRVTVDPADPELFTVRPLR